MRYVIARLEEYNRDMTYRFYISNSLQNIPQNKYTVSTLYDLLYNEYKENLTGDDVAVNVIQRAGLTFEE